MTLELCILGPKDLNQYFVFQITVLSSSSHKLDIVDGPSGLSIQISLPWSNAHTPRHSKECQLKFPQMSLHENNKQTENHLSQIVNMNCFK